jgi:hypothetical protein
MVAVAGGDTGGQIIKEGNNAMATVETTSSKADAMPLAGGEFADSNTSAHHGSTSATHALLP